MTYLSNWRVWLYGFLSWLIPFIGSFLFFNPSGELTIAQPLFKSLMVVIGGSAGVVLLLLAFKRVAPTTVSGLIIGILWLAINLGLDLLVLVPMGGMTITEYFYDIGLRYLLLPVIAVAMGTVAQNAR